MMRNTFESKSETQNSIKRVFFCLIAILLEIFFIVRLLTSLNKAAPFIEVILRVLALLLVLAIYSENKTAAIKMPWIILILLAPVMGTVIFLAVGLDGGTRSMKKRYAAIDELLIPQLPANIEILENLKQRSPKSGSIACYIARMGRYPVYQNTDVTYYDEAVKGLEAQLEDMARAENYIFMEYHAIENAESWHRIQEILEDRVKHGVDVRIFYDDIGSIGFINMDFARALEAAGIQCRVFNPVMPGLNMFLNNRDHRKITVIDGKVGFVGGYNLANEYFDITHPYGKWKDTGIRLEGDAVDSLLITFLEMWNAVKGADYKSPHIGQLTEKQTYKAKQTGFIQPYAYSPMEKEKVGENVYISMVEKAEKYCWFITPYLIITDEMIHALTLAAKRGVDIRIITPGIPDKKMIYHVTRSFYSVLAQGGVRIYEWTPGFCHAKMSVADDIMATCGTINLDYRSLYHHFENGCFMADCQAVAEIREDMISTMAQSKEVTAEYKEGIKTHLKISQQLLRLFAQLL